MTLRQSFFVPPVPFLVAEELGLFAEAGVEVESRRARSSTEQLDGLHSGEIDLAITAMDNVFVWNQRGVDLRVVAQVEATTLLTVYARPGTRSLDDLSGGRFAVDAMTNGFALIARRLLEEAGVSASFVEAGGVKERLDALIEGTVDGTLLGPPLDELAERVGMVALASANAAFPELPGQGVVVRAQRPAGENAKITAYISALAAATEMANHMADADGVALLKENGFPGRSAVNAWRSRPSGIAVDSDGLALVESIRADFGLLPPGYKGAADILDGSFAGL
ncbi:MAG: ABC transporter substrate-binding protein [Salinibacterium sp.]|nr:ABC transporter substrate-binding protein [Salinibacterium sp.]